MSFSFIPLDVPCFLATIKTPFLQSFTFSFCHCLQQTNSDLNLWDFHLHLFVSFLLKIFLAFCLCLTHKTLADFLKEVFAVSPWHLLSSIDLGLYIFVIISLQLCRSSLSDVPWTLASTFRDGFWGGSLSLFICSRLFLSLFPSIFLVCLFLSLSLSLYIYVYTYLSLSLPLVFFLFKDWILRAVSLFVIICLQTLHLFSPW